MSRKKQDASSLIILPKGHSTSRHNSSSTLTYSAFNGKMLKMLYAVSAAFIETLFFSHRFVKLLLFTLVW